MFIVSTQNPRTWNVHVWGVLMNLCMFINKQLYIAVSRRTDSDSNRKRWSWVYGIHEKKVEIGLTNFWITSAHMLTEQNQFKNEICVLKIFIEKHVCEPELFDQMSIIIVLKKNFVARFHTNKEKVGQIEIFQFCLIVPSISCPIVNQSVFAGAWKSCQNNIKYLDTIT